jgi:hypothetical protein
LTALRRMLEDKTPTLMSRLIGGGTWQADKACTGYVVLHSMLSTTKYLHI